jgi:hypothetical protein
MKMQKLARMSSTLAAAQDRHREEARYLTVQKSQEIIKVIPFTMFYKVFCHLCAV